MSGCLHSCHIVKIVFAQFSYCKFGICTHPVNYKFTIGPPPPLEGVGDVKCCSGTHYLKITKSGLININKCIVVSISFLVYKV